MALSRFMRRLERPVLLVVALAFLGTGIAALGRGDSSYRNYWGGPVSAYGAILIGVLLFFIAVFRWHSWKETGRPPKLRGRAARKARQAKGRSPFEDFQRPWS